jgi:hypothetical protein
MRILYHMQLIDKEKIRESLEIVITTGQVFEIRVLDAVTVRKSYPHIWSGYFDNPTAAAEAIEQANFQNFGGLYWTLNPVKPELLGRAFNKLRPVAKDPTTADGDVLTRRWMLIDCDPVRASGISSSDAEHALANEKGNAVDHYLYELGFPAAIFADSGNGRHLLYAIDVPAQDDGLIERGLAHLAKEFDDELVKIDTTVFNPARICRMYGATNGKGDADADKMNPPRPHRMARIIQVPDVIELVPQDALERLASLATKSHASSAERLPAIPSNQFDLDGLLATAKFEIDPPKPYQGGRKWNVPICPWNPDHSNGSAFIIQRADGPIQAGCHHNGCRDHRWPDLRNILEPDWKEKKQAKEQQKNDRRDEPQKDWLPKTNPKHGERAIQSRNVPHIDQWKPFPIDALPKMMAGYVREVASSIQCDESMVAVPLLIAIASGIGATRRLRLTQTWKVPAILWSVLIAESGSKKSQPLQRVKAVLRDLEDAANAEYQDANNVYERDILLYEVDKKTWQHKSRHSNEPPPEKPREPIRKRYLFDNTTLEALAKLIRVNSRGLSGLIDELGGWLASFGEYKGKSSGDASRWLELYNGNSTIIDRVANSENGRTIDIPRSAINIFGTIQPVTLQQALGREHFENGMAARLLMFRPPTRKSQWRGEDPSLKFEDSVRWRLGELYRLEFDLDVNGSTKPRELALSNEAESIWGRYYNEHNDQQHAMTGRLAAAWSKLEEIPARLALVLQLASVPEAAIVESDILENAIRITEWFKNEARRVYSELELNDLERDTLQTIRLIEKLGGRIRVRELQSKDRRFRGNASEAETELQYLADSGRGRWENIPPGPNGGRAVQEFVLESLEVHDDL